MVRNVFVIACEMLTMIRTCTSSTRLEVIATELPRIRPIAAGPIRLPIIVAVLLLASLPAARPPAALRICILSIMVVQPLTSYPPSAQLICG